MATTYTKTCPDCGAVNDSNDLFCKDCGTSLAMVDSTDQQTAAFTPVFSEDETQTTSIAPAAVPPSQPTDYTSFEPMPQQASYEYMPQAESSRGAVLGWLAATLMLVIVAAFIWSSVITDATRDRITGIF